MNLLYIVVKVRIQVHPLRISKQNILVKNENMTEKKILSNTVDVFKIVTILPLKSRVVITSTVFYICNM
mgnify:CR=1 FL=1